MLSHGIGRVNANDTLRRIRQVPTLRVMFTYPTLQSLTKLLRLAFFALLAIGLVLAVVPGPKTPAPEYSDKIAHALLFLQLALLYCLGFAARTVPPSIFAALTAYGLLIEVIQYFIPWRTFSLADLLADVTGVLLYMLIAKLWWLSKGET